MVDAEIGRIAKLLTAALQNDLVNERMTKGELESLIHGVAGAMIYGLYLMKFSEGDGPEAGMIQRMRETGIKFEAPDGTFEGLDANQLHARYSDANDLKISKGNFVFLLRSSLVRFTYEAIHHYAESVGHVATLKNEPWFLYARMLRNVVSHGEHSLLDRWPGDLSKGGIDSVTWRHRTIRVADVGTQITFDLYDAWKLHLDMLDLVQKRLP